MNKYYDLKIQRKAELYVVICFSSKEICELNLKSINFYCIDTKLDLFGNNATIVVPVYLDGRTNKCKSFYFPQERTQYTSLNFIIRDITHKTQHAVQILLDGTLIEFTEMIYGE